MASKTLAKSAFRPFLIGAVLIYIIWLLGLPLITLVQKTYGQGLGQIIQELWKVEVRQAFVLTLLLCFSAVIFNGIFGTALAYVLVRQSFWGRRFVLGLLDLPFAISAVVVGYALILLFGHGGWLKPITEALGISLVFSVPGMVLATLFVTFPFVVRELMPVLEELGEEQEQAAATLGASPAQIFFKITLPNIKWPLFYGLSLSFARALGEFGAVLVVGAGIAGMTETATIFVFRALEERMYAGAYGASVLLILLSLILLISMESAKKFSHAKRK